MANEKNNAQDLINKKAQDIVKTEPKKVEKKPKPPVKKEVVVQKKQSKKTSKKLINKPAKEELLDIEDVLADDVDEKKTEKKAQKNHKRFDIDKSEKSASIVLNLDVEDSYVKQNPIVSKMARKLDDKKVIKILLYKYSTKVKEYLEDIKEDFAENGVDIDDIKVIYKKDETKKDKIKILLTKKD